jgi:2-polyprenyl-3-methyl-5-hydroxy-6-metoxy-1,4-benzoquinol methylase
MNGRNHILTVKRCCSAMVQAQRRRVMVVAQQQQQQQQHPPCCFRYCFSSVSSPEVAKFNAMHQEWWDAGKNPLIGMNAVRMQYIRQQVVKHRSLDLVRATASSSSSSSSSSLTSLPLQGLKALDIGCGGGIACESLVRLGATHVTGLDPSADLIAAAQQHAANTCLIPNTNSNTLLTYKNMSVEEFLAQHQHQQEANNNSNNNSSSSSSRNPPYFDVICLLEVLEHVRDDSSLHSLLRATSQLLHPTHGLLIVSTMSPTPLAYALTIVGAEYIMRYLPVGTHDFNLYRSPDQVRQVMEVSSVNLEQVNVTGMVLTGPPPILSSCIMGGGSWNWKLDPNNTDVNWIGTYRRQSLSNES